MIVNQRLHARRRAGWRAVGLGLQLQVFLALGGLLQEFLGNIAILIHPARFQLQQRGFEDFQTAVDVIIRRVAALLENGSSAGGKLFVQPFLHALPPQVHDAIDAKVEVSLFKLEQIPE